MRIAMMAGLLAAVGVVGAEPGLARVEGPWCLHTTLGMDAVSSRCDMPSYETCRAAMGGTSGASCTQNPYYAQPAAAPRARKASRRSY